MSISQPIYDKEGREDSNFPIVCETCLGPSEFVRMQKFIHDKECHVCERPATMFRWKPGGEGTRYKQTVICQQCSRVKHVCQVCMFDLAYGLPVQVRDAEVGVDPSIIASSRTNREFQAQIADRSLATADGQSGQGFTDYKTTAPSHTLTALARTAPYYKRNRTRVCSFWQKGECKRGKECPYRHDDTDADPDLQNLSYKDRYYGVNDPLAERILAKVKGTPRLVKPEDPGITTLYVGGLDPVNIKEADIKDVFYAYGEIKSIKFAKARNAAFITYHQRRGAERASDALYNNCTIKGQRCKVLWGKPVKHGVVNAAPVSAAQPTAAAFHNIAAPPSANASAYPSQDPSRIGSD